MKGLLARLKGRKIGIGVLVLQLIASIVLTVFVLKLHMLNTEYTVLMGGALIVVFALMFFANGAKSKFHYAAKVMSVLFVVAFVWGSYYCVIAKSTISSMTGKSVQIEHVAVYVLKENKATSITGVADGKFAVLRATDGDKTEETIQTINKNVGKNIATTDYDDPTSVAKVLYDKTVDAVIMEESFVDVLKEQEAYKTFDQKTKKLESYEHKTVLEGSNFVSDVTEKPFSVFLSGIDTFGDVNLKSRCDVNLIVTVNPKTKQILLTSTPRDYFVKTTVSGDMRDKLTHAGLYGIKCSTGTLENLYNTKINYYVRVNFSGFKKIIDALGGITAHSDYKFVSAQGPAFVKGDNKMNGKEALAFVRERYAVPNGDYQRIKDQQYVVKGIVDKVCSPAMLTNFPDLMKSMEGNMNTDLKYDDIASFVQMQLSDNAKWNVSMIHVDGLEGEYHTMYSIRNDAKWVMPVDEESVARATSLINRVLDGKTFDQEEAKKVMKNINK